MVCATSSDLADTVRLRSYDVERAGVPVPATICEAALATSAATSFFDAVEIDGRRFVDGALGANNPVREVAAEAKHIWCYEDGADLMSKVKCFVSIGTGHPGKKPINNKLFGFASETLVRLATDTEQEATLFAEDWRVAYEEKRYFRFNVQHGLQDVGLEEYTQRGTILTATDSYLKEQAQDTGVTECFANLMVRECMYLVRAEEYA